jgi:hypothetical protein
MLRVSHLRISIHVPASKLWLWNKTRKFKLKERDRGNSLVFGLYFNYYVSLRTYLGAGVSQGRYTTSFPSSLSKFRYADLPLVLSGISI